MEGQEATSRTGGDIRDRAGHWGQEGTRGLEGTWGTGRGHGIRWRDLEMGRGQEGTWGTGGDTRGQPSPP